MTILVLKPGALSTLQDTGRTGAQRDGVVVCGAMDEASHRIANALVGNPDDAATLEVTMIGPSLRFEVEARIAICGADLAPRLDGEPVARDRALLVKPGEQLDFGRRVVGMRAYLAVRGGFDVPCLIGSRSTYLRGGFGGHEGRALRKGDVLRIGPHGASNVAASPAAPSPDAATLAAVVTALPADDATLTLRVTRGRQWHRFDEAALALFTSAEYRLSPQSDRMGYRLTGPALGLHAPFEMISEAVAFGSVQVPPNGAPIVLMADRQTSGGYPKIADVVSVDLPSLAQAMPGQRLRFEVVTLDAAQALYLAREQAFRASWPSIDATIRA